MKKFRIILFLFLGLCMMPRAGWGQRAYVTDSFEITLRTGPSVENKITLLLRSGQPLEILETQDNWTHVRVLGRGQEDLEGWVMSRYVIAREPWENQARALRKDNASLRGKLEHAEKEWKAAAKTERQVSMELKKTSQSLDRLQKRYDELKEGSADYLELKGDFDAMTIELEKAQSAVQRYAKDNEQLRRSQRNKWFGMGALVLLSGLMIGIVIGRQQKRQRKSLLYE